MSRCDHFTWEVSEAVLVWLAAGYTRRRTEEGMGLKPLSADSIIRSKKARALIAGRAAWNGSGRPERPTAFEAEASRLWLALGYSHAQVAAGMGWPLSRPT